MLGIREVPFDYTPIVGELVFQPGQTTKTITVQVIGDRLKEAAETFFINLSQVTGVIVADSQGMGTIVDNDSSAAQVATRAPGLSDLAALTWLPALDSHAAVLNASVWSQETPGWSRLPRAQEIFGTDFVPSNAVAFNASKKDSRSMIADVDSFFARFDGEDGAGWDELSELGTLVAATDKH